MKSVKLKLDYHGYLANKEWIDRLLAYKGVPLDGKPFGNLTLILNVKLKTSLKSV